MQRQKPKIGSSDQHFPQRPKRRNETCENRRRNGLFLIDDGFRSSGGLDGGVCSQIRTGLR
jgi:hypothetical protein